MNKRYNEQQLFAAWKEWYNNPEDKTLAANMMRLFEPLINTAISSYLGSSYVSDPLMRGRAKSVLFNALKNYDSSKGPISSYAWIHLQRVQRILSKQQSAFKMSEYRIMQLQELDRVTRELKDELGREPSDQELADRMGLSIKKIEKIRSITPASFESSGTADNQNLTFVGATSNRNETEALSYLYDSIEDNVDKYILESTFGLHNKPIRSNREIAQALNLPQSAVYRKIQDLKSKLFEIMQAIGQ